MPLIQRPYQLLSDLVVHEFDPSVGYARAVVPLTVAGTTTLPLGAVLFRAKGTDPTVPYSVVVDATSFVTTNEFAVMIGDYYGYELAPIVATVAASPQNVTVYKRGTVILKDFTVLTAVKANFAGITTTQFGVLKHLLGFQNVLVETAGTVVRPTI